MEIDEKLGYALMLEALIAASLLSGILFAPELAQVYRLWEILPAVLASMITTFGLKEMKKKT